MIRVRVKFRASVGIFRVNSFRDTLLDITTHTAGIYSWFEGQICVASNVGLILHIGTDFRHTGQVFLMAYLRNIVQPTSTKLLPPVTSYLGHSC